MAEYLIQDTTLTNLADKIRVLNGTEETMTPSEMSDIVDVYNNDMETIITEQDDLIEQIMTAIDNMIPKLPAKDTLENMSWADIRTISDAGQAANYWSVGDRKGVTLNGTVGSVTLNGTYYCYILGFDHNAEKEGVNCIHFQFGYTALSGGVAIAFVDSGYWNVKTSGSWFNMNNSASNAGGWGSSRMRTVICPAFKSVMSSDLKAVLKATTKYSDNTGGGSNTASYVTATEDEIFLLAEFEVFGERKYANSAEQNYQAQYAWYSAGNSKVKYRHSSTGTTAFWQLRSVVSVSKLVYCSTSPYEEVADSIQANFSVGFAPCFCV